MAKYLDETGLARVWSNIKTYLTNNYQAKGSYASSGHTHTTSIAASSGANQLDLAFGTKYAITAGGTSYVFTMPSAPSFSHQSLGLIVSTTAAGTTEGTTANTTTYLNLLGGGANKDSVQVTGSGLVSVTGAAGKITITGSAPSKNVTYNTPTSGQLAKFDSTSGVITASGYSLWVGTQAQYDAIASKSSTTIYIIQ